MDHKALQAMLTKGLDKQGWYWCHAIKLKGQNGQWLTGIRGTLVAGFPDVLALRAGYVLVIECKVPPDKPSPAQLETLTNFASAGALAWVVRPADDREALARWIAHPDSAPNVYGFTPLESSTSLQPKETP